MLTPHQLVDRAAALAARSDRALLGIAGAPAAGKTTVARWLVGSLLARGVDAVHVPMDGYHLADVALDRLGRRDRKGAIDTFDAGGYLALLRRLRADTGTVVYAPEFEREIEQPLAGAIDIAPSARIVVSEGNYLLSPLDPWPSVRAEFDEVWFAGIDSSLRLARLHARHVRYGKTPDEATAWIDSVDEPNARDILAVAGGADLQIDVDALGDLTRPAN